MSDDAPDRGFHERLTQAMGTLSPETQKQARAYEAAASELWRVVQEARDGARMSPREHGLFAKSEARFLMGVTAALDHFAASGDGDERLRDALRDATVDATARRETIETAVFGRAPGAR